MTDVDVIAAIRANHLKANISNPTYVRYHWSKAWVDPGGTIFGPGPYVHLPVDWLIREGSTKTTRVTIRVYAPERLRRRVSDVRAGWLSGGEETYARAARLDKERAAEVPHRDPRLEPFCR